MRLKQIVIKNYRQLKSQTFDPSDWTVVVGPNGSGKSTLARAIDFALRGVQSTEINYANGVQGLRVLLARSGPLEVTYTLALDDTDLVNVKAYAQQLGQAHDQYRVGSYTIIRTAGLPPRGGGETFVLTSHGLERAKNAAGDTFEMTQNVSSLLTYYSENQMILIPAERRLGIARGDGQPGYAADGERLLHELFEASTNHDVIREEKYDRFNRCMIAIFPEFKRIKSVSRSGRGDLNYGDYPSPWVGTGHREATAIVGELAMSSAPVVVIEEPERSFHPGLIRHFLACIREEFPEKQFIIMTHSPVVIASTSSSDIWECRKDFSIRKVSSGDIAAVAANIGVRLSDVLDYELLLLVEGDTDSAAWNVWFEKENLNRRCHAIDINGFGNAQYYANAKIIQARVNRPIVCVAFDGDILAKRGGQDNVDKARPLCDANGGKLFKCDRDTLEEYLLNATAIAAIYEKDAGNVSTWIEDAKKVATDKQNKQLEKNPRRERCSVAKPAIGEVLWKVGEMTFDDSQAAAIARALDRGNYPKDTDGNDLIGELRKLLAMKDKASTPK